MLRKLCWLKIETTSTRLLRQCYLTEYVTNGLLNPHTVRQATNYISRNLIIDGANCEKCYLGACIMESGAVSPQAGKPSPRPTSAISPQKDKKSPTESAMAVSSNKEVIER